MRGFIAEIDKKTATSINEMNTAATKLKDAAAKLLCSFEEKSNAIFKND
jgi:hypothetical protein